MIEGIHYDDKFWQDWRPRGYEPGDYSAEDRTAYTIFYVEETGLEHQPANSNYAPCTKVLSHLMGQAVLGCVWGRYGSYEGAGS